jgi:hypothetical protein
MCFIQRITGDVCFPGDTEYRHPIPRTSRRLLTCPKTEIDAPRRKPLRCWIFLPLIGFWHCSDLTARTGDVRSLEQSGLRGFAVINMPKAKRKIDRRQPAAA